MSWWSPGLWKPIIDAEWASPVSAVNWVPVLLLKPVVMERVVRDAVTFGSGVGPSDD